MRTVAGDLTDERLEEEASKECGVDVQIEGETNPIIKINDDKVVAILLIGEGLKGGIEVDGGEKAWTDGFKGENTILKTMGKICVVFESPTVRCFRERQ